MQKLNIWALTVCLLKSKHQRVLLVAEVLNLYSIYCNSECNNNNINIKNCQTKSNKNEQDLVITTLAIFNKMT